MYIGAYKAQDSGLELGPIAKVYYHDIPKSEKILNLKYF
jgi:hypothetical protein